MMSAADATSGDAVMHLSYVFPFRFCLLLVVGSDRRSHTSGLSNTHFSWHLGLGPSVAGKVKTVQLQRGRVDSEEVRRASRLLSAFVSSQIQALQLDPVPEYISVP